MRVVINKINNYYRRGPKKPAFTNDPHVIRKTYERYRNSVFFSIILGYGFYYVCRLSISVVKKPIIDEGLLTATQMGMIGSALLIVYAVSKFVNGFLGDRANIKKYIPTGLLISALLNLALGFTNLFVVFIVLWGLNGWFQGMGGAPSVVAISQWFSHRERGTRYGIWSISHSLGEGFTFICTSVVVSSLGWRWGFWLPGISCIAVAFIIHHYLADHPEAYGLPPSHVYKNDHPHIIPHIKETVKSAQWEVVKNPAIWILGLSSAFLYVSRYGVNSWAILFLQESKHYSLVQAGSVLSAYPIMGILGTAFSGWFSDKFFHARRNWPTLIFGSLMTVSLTGFYLLPPGFVLLDSLLLGVFGFALGAVLCYVGGLTAVDLSSKKATGAAMGTIGMFSYIGAAAQDTISGVLIDAGKIMVDGQARYNFDNAVMFWISAAVISTLLPLFVWKVKPKI